MRSLVVAALGVVLLASPSSVARAQHEPIDVTVEDSHAATHHTPEINWTGSGTDAEGQALPPPLAGMLISFAIWLGLIVYLARKPLASFLVARRAAIVDGIEEAKRVEAAAQAKHAEYTARIENLDAEIAALREEFSRAGMQERDRMVAEAADRAHKLHAEAHFLVQQQMKQLREELTRESIDAAVAAAEKILRERATAADQQRLADEYLARLRASVERGGSDRGIGKGAAS
jgi:F-type H+-transporting ATPase subunit b